MNVSVVNSAGGSFCWNYATDRLMDLSVTIMQVTVSVAIMQLEFSAAHMQVTVSTAVMWVTIFL